jgi:D-lyxose ketol-isomerase
MFSFATREIAAQLGRNRTKKGRRRMKRSEINKIMRDAERFIRGHGFVLPPFAYYTPQEMRARAGTAIHACRLGWDITDYGAGNFDAMGLFLFTLRNGRVADLAKGRGMLYAEKIMISRVGQLSPMHRHDLKAEDIINRGGGDLVIQLFMPAGDGSIDRSAQVTVPVDGELRRLGAGGHLRLKPGESVTLLPGIWHAFRAEGADCLIGEVSTVNDDLADNIFEAPIGRFATIEEDEAPLHLLVSDY